MSEIEKQAIGPRGVGIGIVAFGPSKSLVNWDATDWTYWTMNDGYRLFARRISALFEMHPESHYADPTQYAPGHVEWMAAARHMVWLAFPNPKIPNARIYPLDKVLERFKRRYFLSTLCYMIPLAVTTIEESQRAGDGLYAPRIGIWGADMYLTTEYAKERSCVEYWASKAEDAGIEVFVPDESPLLKATYDYGYETAAMSRAKALLLGRQKELSQKLVEAQLEDRAVNHKVSSIQGMLDECGHQIAALTDAPPNGVPWT